MTSIYSTSQYKFDSGLSSVEDTLSKAALFPGVGVVSGTVKVLIGLIQTVVAGILTAAFKCTGNEAHKEYAKVHVKHGLANMGIGVLEAIPLVGTVITLVRVLRDGTLNSYGEDEGPQIVSAHQFKFKSYPSLEERDFKFDNCTKEEEEVLDREYQTLIPQNPTLTYRNIASRAVQNYNTQQGIRADLARNEQRRSQAKA